MTDETTIFDRSLLARNRARALKNFSNHDFLFRWSRNALTERLDDINRTFETAVQIGARSAIEEHPKVTDLFTMDLSGGDVVASEEFLPFQTSSLDLVISTLNLHSVNDLPGALVQIRRALKPDGLFLSCMLGGETLHELRAVMQRVEMEMFGGASPRVAPFADKPQMGDLLQRAGFALPVVDSDIVSVMYENAFKLFHDLRGMGESNALAARNKRYVGRDFFMRVAQMYQEMFAEADGRIPASFEVIFLAGWAPHRSQQKPLRPGSAEHSLAEALGGDEVTLGEKAVP